MNSKKKYKRLYNSPSDIPVHIFKNAACTVPVGQEFREYLRYMLEHHPDDLEYIFRNAQQYSNYGGTKRIPFDVWKGQLKRQLNKTRKEDGLNELE